MNTLFKLAASAALFYAGMQVARKVVKAYPADEEGFWDLADASPFMTDLGVAVVGGATVFFAGKLIPRITG